MERAETPIQYLQEALEQRMRKNPQYSMRSFAQALGLNVGSLSGLLSGKRKLTEKTANQIFARLEIDPVTREKLLLPLRVKAKGKLADARAKQLLAERVRLENETFRVLSDWYHYAILQLLRTDVYLTERVSQPIAWIASQVGITEAEASLALRRLQELHLIRAENGKFVRTKNRLTTADKTTTSAALRRWQRQIREKAIHSLENDPIEIRSMTSMTIAIDPARLPEARELIEEFQERIGEFMESSGRKQVYQLEISLFPLQKQEKKK